MHRLNGPFAVLSLVFLSGAAGYLLAQQGPGGVRSEVLAEADLGTHFSCMDGMELKLARHEIDPRGGGSEHSHRGRPEVFYVIEGSVVEHQGANSRTYRAGEGFVSNSDLSVPHRIENASDSVALVLDAQIVSKAPAAARQ